GWGFFNWRVSLFLVAAFLEAVLAAYLRSRVRNVISPVEKRGPDLLLLAGLLSWLERAPVAAPRLRQLQEELVIAGLPPSQRLARLPGLLDWLESRHNAFFAPFAALLMWTTHMAFAIETWRLITGPAISRWVRVVGEFEALCALATYAYEN